LTAWDRDNLPNENDHRIAKERWSTATTFLVQYNNKIIGDEGEAKRCILVL
jgi:hypothetical protein